MVPTLEIGQRVLVDRLSKNFSDYERGDVLVFKPPAGADANSCGVQHSDQEACPKPTEDRSDTNFIKRVVAVGGDHIKVLGGAVYINGKRQNESFARLERELRELQPARGDHDPEGLLLHDGRQPGRQRRQSRVGADPQEMGDRPGLRDLLATRQNRLALAAPGRPSAAFRRASSYHRLQRGQAAERRHRARPAQSSGAVGVRRLVGRRPRPAGHPAPQDQRTPPVRLRPRHRLPLHRRGRRGRPRLARRPARGRRRPLRPRAPDALRPPGARAASTTPSSTPRRPARSSTHSCCAPPLAR